MVITSMVTAPAPFLVRDNRRSCIVVVIIEVEVVGQGGDAGEYG